ncbi:MAG: hypothetical protein AAGB11_20015 [Pseudomonadota bacterium]
MKNGYKFAIIAVAVTVGSAAVASAMSPRMLADFDALEGDAPVELVRDAGGRWSGRGGRDGRQVMRQVLREADTNGDNALSQGEINAFITAKVNVGDTNDDNRITLEEFEAIWLDVSRGLMVRAFQELDENGDAVIERTELDERFGNIVALMDRNDDGVLDRADRRRHRRDR